MTEINDIYKNIINALSIRDSSSSMAHLRELVVHIQRYPETIPDLAKSVLETYPAGGTFFDFVLSFLPIERWPNIVELAVTTLERQPDHQAAQDIISYASLQYPRTVHPYLEQLMPIMGYHLNEAFRELPLEEAGFLFAAAKKILSGGQWVVEEKRVFLALLETQLPEALEFVRSHREQYLFYLSEVGFEETPTGFRQLYPSRVWHLAFPSDYLSQMWSFLPRYDNKSHPTWVSADSHAPRYRFGGMSETICGVCGELAHHLITLDPIPSELGITRLSRLEVVVCLSCLGWGQGIMSYQHDANGKPQAIHQMAGTQELENSAVPLKETEVNLLELGARWRWQDWGAANGRENLHRVGGYPSWVQPAEYPKCPLCEKTSTFLLQLDSDLPTLDDYEWLWGGDTGVAYTFWCDKCKVTTLFWQTT